MLKYAHIIGWGSYLPDRILTNQELAKTVDTNDEWIRARTGIHQRHIAASNETTATIAFEAAARALAVAQINPSDIGLIIVATSTPEYVFPSTACRVQDYLGARRAGAFDLSAACTGFVYALSMAANAIATESVNSVLVIGTETMSRVLDWQDRSTCILFGDGAGAIVLRGSSVPGGVMSSILRSDGSGGDLLRLPTVYNTAIPVLKGSYVNGHHESNTIEMDGRQVFRFATKVVANVIADAVTKAGLTMDDIDLIIPHQANSRIIESAAKKLKISTDRFYMNIAQVGNTSAASIPLALCDAVAERQLKPDNNVVFVGFGGGLTWGASVVKWDVTPPDMEERGSEWRRTRYVAARARSKLRQWQRKTSARLAGSPTPEARLKDADKQGTIAAGDNKERNQSIKKD